MTEGARYERLQSYLLDISVDLQPQPEGLEDGAALLRICRFERLREIGQRVENRGGLLYIDPPAVAARLLKLSNQRLDLLPL